MTDERLNELLRQIGKSAFVRYFDELRDGHDAMLYGEYKPGGVHIRMTCSRGIFLAKREFDALRIIINSPRISQHDKMTAAAILKRHNQ